MDIGTAIVVSVSILVGGIIVWAIDALLVTF